MAHRLACCRGLRLRKTGQNCYCFEQPRTMMIIGMAEASRQFQDNLSVEELLKQARRNERIARALFDIEAEVMKHRECGGFVDCLVDRVRERFALDDVWLVLTDIELNDRIHEVLIEQGTLSLIVRAPTVDFMRLTGSTRTPFLISEPAHYRQLIPVDWHDRLGSMAVLPLLMDDRVVGALVLGAKDASRYHPDMESFFLEQLAVKASLGLDSTWTREQLSRLATRDALTGLRNRREMEAILEKELSRSRRYGQPVSLLFIDCDDFKAINDTHGHDCGDAYLCFLASELQRLLREDDIVFRFAGDEFVVVLPNQSLDDARGIGERLRGHMTEQAMPWGEHRIPVSFSLGMAGNEEPGMNDFRNLLRFADQRLYEEKRQRQG